MGIISRDLEKVAQLIILLEKRKEQFEKLKEKRNLVGVRVTEEQEESMLYKNGAYDYIDCDLIDNEIDIIEKDIKEYSKELNENLKKIGLTKKEVMARYIKEKYRIEGY